LTLFGGEIFRFILVLVFKEKRMRNQAKVVCWRAASWTFIAIVLLGFVASVIIGS